MLYNSPILRATLFALTMVCGVFFFVLLRAPVPAELYSSQVEIVLSKPRPSGAAENITDSVIRTAEIMVKQDQKERKGTDSVLVSIGALIDPDDPATWPNDDAEKFVSIGEPLLDPYQDTFDQHFHSAVMSIGDLIDPDDPATWPEASELEVVSIGISLESSEEPYRLLSEGDETINIGERLGPEYIQEEVQ